jgi:endonuclease YncB( thermonuclease family)
LPWVFVLGVVAGTLLPVRQWAHWPIPWTRDHDSEIIRRRAGDPNVRHPVDVIRTIDGDTFEARVHLQPGPDVTTRVRLRGIDAPELKAACPQELQMAEAAGSALRGLLDEGEVTIYNIGPDKYNGRVVADAATRRTDNVSAALLASGHVRSYGGGHRSGWCAGASR